MTDAKINTIVTANTTNLEAGLNRAIRSMQKAEGQFSSSSKKSEAGFKALGRSIGNFVGLLAGAAITSYAKSLVDMAGNLKDLSLQSGIASSTLSALKSVLEQGGSNVDEFSSSIEKMNKNISQVAQGDNDKLAASLKQIGVSINSLASLSPEEQFFTLAKALGEVENQGDLTRIGMEIFGKSFTSLIPLIKETNGDLREYVNTAIDAGNALTQEQINTLDDFGDAMTRAGNDIGNAISGGFADFLNWMREFNTETAGFDAIPNGVVAKAVASAQEMKKAAEEAYMAKAKAEGFVTQARGPLPSDFIGPKAPTAKPFTPSSSSKKTPTVSGTEKLTEALAKLKRESARDIYTHEFTDLDKKLKEVDFTVQDLATSYKTKLTPEQINNVEAIKDQVRTLDDIQKAQLESERLADDLGGAFSDAFEQGILGAESFGDVMGSLAKQIQKIFFQQAVANPLNDIFGSLFKGAGGAGGIFDGIGSALGSFLPSFATGISNVPYDMTARLHAGETVMTRQETDAMSRGQGAGSAAPCYNIDARGAGANELRELRGMMIALAGPGVIERRVNNAQIRGSL